MTIRNLEHALAPRSIAVIGASAEKDSVGNVLTENVLGGGFAGKVFLVNPHSKEVAGRPCFASVAALPETPELAVIATPPKTVPDLVRQLGAKGTRAIVVITAGLSVEERQAMLDAARPYCLRIIGPNCLGIAVPGISLNATFGLGRPLLNFPDNLALYRRLMLLKNRPQLGRIRVMKSFFFGQGARIDQTANQLSIHARDKTDAVQRDGKARLESDYRSHARPPQSIKMTFASLPERSRVREVPAREESRHSYPPIAASAIRFDVRDYAIPQCLLEYRRLVDEPPDENDQSREACRRLPIPGGPPHRELAGQRGWIIRDAAVWPNPPAAPRVIA